MRAHFAGFVERVYAKLATDHVLAQRYFPASVRAALLSQLERWAVASGNDPASTGLANDVELAAARGRCRATRPAPSDARVWGRGETGRAREAVRDGVWGACTCALERDMCGSP